MSAEHHTDDLDLSMLRRMAVIAMSALEELHDTLYGAPEKEKPAFAAAIDHTARTVRMTILMRRALERQPAPPRQPAPERTNSIPAAGRETPEALPTERAESAERPETPERPETFPSVYQLQNATTDDEEEPGEFEDEEDEEEEDGEDEDDVRPSTLPRTPEARAALSRRLTEQFYALTGKRPGQDPESDTS